jgi:hypothetical protein
MVKSPLRLYKSREFNFKIDLKANLDHVEIIPVSYDKIREELGV